MIFTISHYSICMCHSVLIVKNYNVLGKNLKQTLNTFKPPMNPKTTRGRGSFYFHKNGIVCYLICVGDGPQQ